MVVHPGCFLHHEVRRFQFDPAAGLRVLDTLVLADGTVKHLTLVGAIGGAAQFRTAQADGFGGDQDPLGVQPMQV